MKERTPDEHYPRMPSYAHELLSKAHDLCMALSLSYVDFRGGGRGRPQKHCISAYCYRTSDG